MIAWSWAMAILINYPFLQVGGGKYAGKKMADGVTLRYRIRYLCPHARDRNTRGVEGQNKTSTTEDARYILAGCLRKVHALPLV